MWTCDGHDPSAGWTNKPNCKQMQLKVQFCWGRGREVRGASSPLLYAPLPLSPPERRGERREREERGYPNNACTHIQAQNLEVCEIDAVVTAKLKKFRFRKEKTNAAIVSKSHDAHMTLT